MTTRMTIEEAKRCRDEDIAAARARYKKRVAQIKAMTGRGDRLSVRSRNCLANTLGTSDFKPEDVARLSIQELLRTTYNFGNKSILEVRLWLKRYGLDLKP